MKTINYWSAPATFDHILSGQSSWHVKLTGSKYTVGHFALTGHGDALDARYNKLPTGRTRGRALRAFRRKLRCNPVEFSPINIEDPFFNQ